MAQDSEETVVVFRYWTRKDYKGTIIAIFPMIASDCTNPRYCESFCLLDGLGDCDPYMIRDISRPATPEEYGETREVLEKQYEYKLKIRQKMPSNAYNVRYDYLRSFYSNSNTNKKEG